MNEIVFVVTGKTGKIDGYVEIVLGTMLMSGILLGHKLSKTTHDNGTTSIHIDLKLANPPIPHMGEKDIPERKADETD